MSIGLQITDRASRKTFLFFTMNDFFDHIDQRLDVFLLIGFRRLLGPRTFNKPFFRALSLVFFAFNLALYRADLFLFIFASMNGDFKN